MVLKAGMAELADAADLKSAGLKKLVGVRVPLSAPCIHRDPSHKTLRDFACGLPLTRSRGIVHARKTAQLKIRRAHKVRGVSSPPLGTKALIVNCLCGEPSDRTAGAM